MRTAAVARAEVTIVNKLGLHARASAKLTQLASGVYALGSQPAAHGAWPTLYAATRPGLVGGEYAGPSGPGETRGRPVLVRAVPAAYYAGLGRALWDRSVELTGVDYRELDG